MSGPTRTFLDQMYINTCVLSTRINRNRAKGGDRRAYMRAWRARNPGYMARKGREHRDRRRLGALALAATNDGDAQ